MLHPHYIHRLPTSTNCFEFAVYTPAVQQLVLVQALRDKLQMMTDALTVGAESAQRFAISGRNVNRHRIKMEVSIGTP